MSERTPSSSSHPESVPPSEPLTGWEIFSSPQLERYLHDPRFFPKDFPSQLTTAREFIETKSTFYQSFATFMKDASRVLAFRRQVLALTGPNPHDDGIVHAAIATLLDEADILPRVFPDDYSVVLRVVGVNSAAVNKIIELLKYQLFPDDYTVHRNTPTASAGLPGDDGYTSNWGFSTDGKRVAAAYSTHGNINISSTLGALRQPGGIVVNDFKAIELNAVKLLHAHPETPIAYTLTP